MIYDFFKTVLNMSLTASFVITVVLMARLFLRRAPKWISYALWAVVLFNLVCPFKLDAPVSLIPQSIPEATISQPTYSVQFPKDITVETADYYKEQYAQNPDAFPLKRVVTMENLAVYAWYIGIAIMLLYAAISYISLKRRVSLAVRVESNIYETDRIDSPFVLGLIRPHIYVPLGMELNGYIIEHERTHIKRLDYLVAVAAFVALSLHWFNPFVWAAYFCILRDMESSCDESVLRRYGADIRREYSSALLSLSSKSRRLPIPLAFGEQDVKGRIRNVLNFKKHSKIVIIAAIVLVVVLSVGFAVNRANGDDGSRYDFRGFTFNGFTLGANINAIDLSVLHEREPNTLQGYKYNYDEIRFDTDDVGRITRYFVVVESEDYDIWVARIGDDMAVSRESSGNTLMPTIKDMETFLGGNGKIGWQDREQKLRYEEYKDESGNIVRFVYFVGEANTNGLVWVIAESGLTNSFAPFSSDWLGNPNGEEMTVEQMKLFAERFVLLSRLMTIQTDLSNYKGFNFSSASYTYLMEYPVEGRLVGLIVRADGDGVINSVTIRRISDSERLELNSSTYARIDGFISGEFTPEVEPALWNVITPHRVSWNEKGAGFAWQHADDPNLGYISSVWYVPLKHFDNATELSRYVAEGNEIFDYASIFETYNAEFFKNNLLLVIYVEEGSGSIQHDVASVEVENNNMKIGIVRSVPEAQTDDMLARFILIECSKEATQTIKNYVAYIAPSLISTSESEPLTAPVGIVRSELIAAGYEINYVFVLSQNDRKSLDGVDNGELSTVYASYNDGDAIYCMQYSFERQTHKSEWTHGEPIFWNGIAIDVAAYVAREYYSEKYGDNYDDIGVSWAQNITNDYSSSDGRKDWKFADFYIGRNGGEENGGDIPALITLGSPDGQSNWTVVEFNGIATAR